MAKEEIFETEDWNEGDYDSFLDYLEELDELEEDNDYDDDYIEDDDDDDYSDETENMSAQIVPAKNHQLQRRGTPFQNTPAQQYQQQVVQYDGNTAIGSTFNTLASSGINIGFCDNNGSTVTINGNGIGINLNPNTLINLGKNISNAYTERKYKKMKAELKKNKRR